MLLALPGRTEERLTEEAGTDAYHYVSTYRTEINASAEQVWPHLLDFGSWMVDFDMSHQGEGLTREGSLFRLYPGQDFFIQVLSLVPHESVVIANLPSRFRGEDSTGIGVISLTQIPDGTTVLNLTMSRRYKPTGSGAEELKNMRQSPGFRDGTSETWNRFLTELKARVETAE